MAASPAGDLHQKLDRSLWISSPTNRNPLTFLKRAHESRRGWKQSTKRNPALNGDSSVSAESRGPEHHGRRDCGRRKNTRTIPHAVEAVTEQDRAAQHAQFNTWLEEQLEQRNTVADLHQTSSTKPKRTVRRSVYGSLSSTKSFFRGQSKTPLGRLYSRTGLSVPTTPHLYIFETKDQLREYLNNGAVVSPSSPMAKSFHVSDTIEEAGPVELSASTTLAELEGTSLNGTAKIPGAVSRMSTPSIRDLPPYNDDKRFQDDMAKGPDNHSTNHVTRSIDEPGLVTENCYVCSSCHNTVAGHDVYDFCSICDSSDRILCTNCAARGPCCRHELEGIFRSRTSSEHNPVLQRAQSNRVDTPQSSSFNVPRPSGYTPRQIQLDALSKQHSEPSHAEHVPDQGVSDPGSHTQYHTDRLHEELWKEMSTLRREQDLLNRERELGVRAREIDLRDQQASLREREAIVQQRSDLLIKSLESIVSYQELAKSAFIGAQFQSQRAAEKSSSLSSHNLGADDTTSAPEPIVLDCSDHCQRQRSSVRTVVVEAEATIHGLTSQDLHAKTHAAQKRKKEGTNASNGSTPASAPATSPEQSRKPLSRGNSERDGSQDDEEDEDHRRSPKKTKQESSPPNGPQVLFACPFAKNNPMRFSSRNVAEKNYRGCGTHYLPGVSRLKQHLKRVHWQPESYCPRCYEEFENSAKLAEHAGAPVACIARENPFPEKMDKTQQEKIHVKRPRVHPSTVWYDIYKTLFPGQPLPDSPYMDADDPIITPISATPLSDVNFHATRMLTAGFKKRLDQSKDLQNNSLRPLIEQALDDSFRELLASFTLSPNASPGAGPSIIVSPVSRSSSETSRPQHSPVITPSRLAKLERQRSVTNVISQPQHVPLLQQPRPPRPKVNTALQVPTDHHRSPSIPSRRESQSGSPVDGMPNFNILPHTRDDVGYDDECNSFELGDDRQAMAFVGESATASARNKSVMSVDSGYGSRRHRHQSAYLEPTSVPAVPDTWSHMDDLHQGLHKGSENSPEGHRSALPSVTSALSGFTGHFPSTQPEHSTNHFESYCNYFDPLAQEDMLSGMEFPLFDQNDTETVG